MAMPTWISEVQALAIPIGTGAIALVGVWIAAQQARTARQKLRLDLFPLRMAVYNVVLDSISGALNERGESVFDDSTRELNLKIREARFLFDAPVFEYLNALESRILAVRHYNINTKGPDPVREQKYLDAYHKDKMSLFDDFKDLPARLESALKVDETATFSKTPARSAPNT